MPILSKDETLTAVSDLYRAKQELSDLDAALNAQAATIMDKARAEVEVLKDATKQAREVASAAVTTAETKLLTGV